MCLVFLSLIGAVFLLQYGQPVLLPVFVSLLFYYALDPVVCWISRAGIPRTLSCAILLVALLGTAGATVFLLRGQAAEMVGRLPEALHKAKAAIESQRGGATGAVAKVQQAAGELEKTASSVSGANEPRTGVTRVQVEEPAIRIGDYLWSGSLGLMSLLGQAITVLFLVFFLLASGDLYKRKLLKVVGPPFSRQRLTLQILNEIDKQIGRFLLVQICTSALIGTALGITLWLLGLNQPAVWGVSAGILNSIPYFGTIIVTCALALAAFLQFGTLKMVVVIAGVTLVVTSIDGFFLTPLLTSRFSKMNNVAVFLSLLFWGWLWGAMGMLLAVPIMMVVKSICDHIESLKPIGHLLGDAGEDA